MPDAVSTLVADGQGVLAWESAMYDRAFEYWSLFGNNARRTERLLQVWAQEQTADGEPIPAVPSRSTISQWARRDNWERRELEELLRDLPGRVLRIRKRGLRMIESAQDTLDDIDAGRFDHDPGLVNAHYRGAIEKLKLGGFGTAGANAGGLFALNVQEVMLALGVGASEDGEALSDGERSRRNRDAIEASKRGQE